MKPSLERRSEKWNPVFGETPRPIKKGNTAPIYRDGVWAGLQRKGD
jgi:hypothetical protein